MNVPATIEKSFGELSPLLAPRTVTVIGASDREGNLGGLAVQFLRKFGFKGAVYPVNAGRTEVSGLPCFPSLAALPEVPDLAIVAVPADGVLAVVGDCIAAGIPAAIVWAGGFAEGDDVGKARQRELEELCRGTGLKLCGPNCIGVINTASGLTASFSSLMTEVDHFTPGNVSMVSQSGGISVTAHARAQELGLGFRLTISCGNEAVLGIPDFIKALAADEGTRVIAVYTEGISDPAGFVDALAEARRRGKPVVILKGGASEASSRAALAHTGRLAGADRTYDAIFREFAAIRVYSMEEMIDVCLLLAQLRPGQLPQGRRVVLSTFGGGSGVIGADQCVREGLTLQPLSGGTRARLAPVLSSLASSLNPVDLTPGSMTNPKHRANMPAVLEILADAPEADVFLFFCAGFGELAPQLVELFEGLRAKTEKPVAISWLSPPAGILEDLARRGVRAFDEHARAIRAMGHVVRYGENMRHRIHQVPATKTLAWETFVNGAEAQVVSEDVASGVLEEAGLPVARGRIARTSEEAAAAAEAVGFPVALKGISPAVTHRAAAGLVALEVNSRNAAAETERRFRARAEELGVTLEGVWVQHMFHGNRELLVTALGDAEFGVMVGVGLGGGLTELLDDVVFSRAPIDAEGAYDLIGRLRTLVRRPEHLTERQHRLAAGFVADFSQLVASAPWSRFTFEVNPLKVAADGVAAVDALLLIE